MIKNNIFPIGEPIQFKRNKISYLLISFNSGIAQISELAINFFFKTQLSVDASNFTQINTIIQLPLVFKPLYGLLSDSIPICGYRRKYYILLCGIINSLSLFIVGNFVNSIPFGIFWLFMANLADSFGSILGQSIVVELSKMSNNKNVNKEENVTNELVTLFYLLKYCGVFIASFFKGYLIDKLSIKTVFIIASVFPLLMIISGCILIEERILKSKLQYLSIEQNAEQQSNKIEKNNKDDIVNVTKHQEEAKPIEIVQNTIISINGKTKNDNFILKFLKFLLQKQIVIPVIYFLFLLSIPGFKESFFYFSNDKLEFTPSQFGWISIITTAMTLIGIYIYKKYFKKLSFKEIVIVLHCITLVGSFFFFCIVKRWNRILKISDLFSVLIANGIFYSANELTSMPLLTVACVLCPKDLEGSVNAMFMSALNFGDILSGFLGGKLVSLFGIANDNYDNFAYLILFITIIEIIPMPILYCIPSNYFPLGNEKEKEKEKKKVIEISIKESKREVPISQLED